MDPTSTATSPRRAYRSAARAATARETRRRIVAAAHALFVEQGYAGTTIDAVAERAGVGRRTVFTSVGAKAELLTTAWDWAVVGDDEPVAVADRPEIARMRATEDPVELVGLWVQQILRVAERVGPLDVVLAHASDVDAEAAALRVRIDGQRRQGATMFLRDLESRGVLRTGLSLEHAVDICWTLMDPGLRLRLVGERGWTQEELEDWLVRLARVSLLG